MPKITDPEIMQLAAQGKLKAIIKQMPGRPRMLFGFERDRKSSKYREKFLLRSPVDLDQLGKAAMPEPTPEQLEQAKLDRAKAEELYANVEKSIETNSFVETTVGSEKEPIPLNKRRTPARQLVLEGIGNAPDFLSLQAGLLMFLKELPFAPREEKKAWQKAADEKVIEFIKRALTIADVNFLLNATQTHHSWPTTEKVKRRFAAVADHRKNQLTLNPEIVLQDISVKK